MMRRIPFVATATLFQALNLLTGLADAANACAGPKYAGPIAVPIQYVQLRPGIERHGTFVQIGRDEKQNFALELNLRTNETYLYDGPDTLPESPCANRTEAQCLALRGGFYDPAAAPGWVESPQRETRPGEARGTDTLVLGGVEMPAAELAVRREFAMNGLGLGANSSLVERLKADGVVASRSWSLWWGRYRTGEGATGGEMDGHLVMGGEDEAKVGGERETFPIRPVDLDDCDTGLVVQMSAMSLDFPDGKSVGLLRTPIQKEYCIAPGFPSIILPATVFDAMIENIGQQPRYGVQGDDMPDIIGPTYPTREAFRGNLTFTLQSGLTISIPASQLSSPESLYDSRGTLNLDPSNRVFYVDSLHDKPLMPRIGGVFFQAAMLTVDHENGVFSLAPATATEEMRLKTIVAKGDTCDPDAPSDEPNADGSQDGGESISRSRPAMTPAAIAGATIGSSAALAAIVTALLLFRRRWSQRRAKSLPSFSSVRSDSPRLVQEKPFEAPAPGNLAFYSEMPAKEGWMAKAHELESPVKAGGSRGQNAVELVGDVPRDRDSHAGNTREVVS